MNLKRRQRNLAGIVAAGVVVAAALIVVQSKGGSSAPAPGGSFALADESPFAIPQSIPSAGSSSAFSSKSGALQQLVPSAPDIDTSSAPLAKPEIPAIEPTTQGASLLTNEELISLGGNGLRT